MHYYTYLVYDSFFSETKVLVISIKRKKIMQTRKSKIL